MPKNKSTKRQRISRSTHRIEREIFGSDNRHSVSEVPVNSKDVARIAKERLKKVETSSVVRAHSDRAITNWASIGAPNKSEEFWRSEQNQEDLGFYIPAYASGLAVVAFCVVGDLKTKNPNEGLGNKYSSVRQASARLVAELLVDACGNLETARSLEEPIPDGLKIWIPAETSDFGDYYDSRHPSTYTDLSTRLAKYDRQSLVGLASTVATGSVITYGAMSIPGTRIR